MLKSEMQELIEKQQKEIEELQGKLERYENAVSPDYTAQIKELKDENARLREYCEMANQESATMSVEIDRVKNKMNTVYEDNVFLVQAIQSLHHQANRILVSSMQEEKQIQQSLNKYKNRK